MSDSTEHEPEIYVPELAPGFLQPGCNHIGIRYWCPDLYQFNML